MKTMVLGNPLYYCAYSWCVCPSIRMYVCLFVTSEILGIVRRSAWRVSPTASRVDMKCGSREKPLDRFAGNA